MRSGMKRDYMEYSLKVLEMKPSLFSNEKEQLVWEIIDLARVFEDSLKNPAEIRTQVKAQ